MIASNTPLFEKVFNEVNIAEAVAKYIDLQKSEPGEFLVGVCPFCIKYVGTLLVNTASKSYFCFHCNSMGNVIDFISKIGSMNKLTAARFLAKTNHLEIQEIKPTPLSGDNDANSKTDGQSLEVHKG